MNPYQFERIGNFAESYHIVLKPDSHPTIILPRKYPIRRKDEFKA